MKKLLLSAVAVCTLAVSFAYTDNALKAAARRFLECYAHMDYGAAKDVSTRATKKQLEQLEEMMDMMGDADGKVRDEARKITVKMMEPRVSEDTIALVDYTLSNEPGVVKTLKMVKRGGRWLAEWSKLDGMNTDSDGSAVDQAGDGSAYDGPVDTNSPH